MKVFNIKESTPGNSFYLEPNSIDRSNDQHKLISTFRHNKVVPDSSDYPIEGSEKEIAKELNVNSQLNLSPKRKSTFPNFDSKRISIARFTENIGKMTKNALNELSETVNQTDFKEEYRKGLIKALNFLDIGSSKNPILKFLKTFIFFNIQVFIFMMNFVSVVNMILISDYRLGDVNQKYEIWLKYVEWSLGCFFTLEVFFEIVFNCTSCSSLITNIFFMGNIMDILLTLEIAYSTIYLVNFKPRLWVFTFIGFLRSLKAIKLRKIVEFNMKHLRKIMESNSFNVDLSSGNEEDEIKFSVMSSVVDIFVSIFIEASALMALNEFLGDDAFTNPGNFTYITATYATIVNLTTIGYGDVIPNMWQSRAFVEIMLLFNITVLSTFIGNLTDRMSKLSIYVRNFSFRDHVVIIGDLPLSFLQFLIEEIKENDMVQERLNTKKKYRKIRFIVVGKDDPPRELENFLFNFSVKNGDAMYLKSNIMETLWYKMTNLQYAKHLFAFSINMKDSEAIAFEKDKHLAFNIQNIINNFPKLPITLTLTTEYEQNINKNQDSLWRNVQTVPFRLLNNYIMANSIENQGFNTWLVHLLTLREKREPLLREDHKESLLQDYMENMTQEIYPIST